MPEEIQPIIQEYFEKQKESKLKLCIYEEKSINTNDIEWFYDEETKKWCCFTVKKERINKEWQEVIALQQKDFKTFGKKCHIRKMSYFTFMTYNFFKFRNCSSEELYIVDKYANDYKKLKEDNINCTIEDYNLQIQKEMQKTDSCLMWGITIFFAATVVGLPIALFTCPLTWKIGKSIKNRFFNKKVITNDEIGEEAKEQNKMKAKLLFTTLILSGFIFTQTAIAEVVVYNHKTKIYHSVSCQHAKRCQSCIRIEKQAAKQKGARPCKVCGG